MKKIITVKRIFHNSIWRYGIFFEYDSQLMTLVRSIPGIRYSGTFRCWYIDENKKNLLMIRDKFSVCSDVEVTSDSPDFKDTGEENSGLGERVSGVPELMSWHDGLFDEKDISNRPGYQDITTMNPFRGIDRGNIKRQHKGGIGYDPVIFTMDELDDKLIIKFTGRYNQDWINELRSFGRLWYDKYRKEWVLDWSRMTVDSLSDYFMGNDVEVIIKKNKVTEAVKGQRETKGTEIRGRILKDDVITGIENVKRYMQVQRYSKKTTGAYVSLLGLFFRYFVSKSQSDITEEDISEFFHEHVYMQGYSSSYQNQIISALKIYYNINHSCELDVSLIDRPRKGRPLPKVFSKEEVRTILNSTRNLKHKLLLWMIYSCGLRRSEVINIKVGDLDRGRGILNIREGKGNADRIVPVSVKVWEKIDEYIGSYHPGYWLFEGQTGGKYSAESVYRVFKQALRNAGIKKDVGVHSLRHSYATHLHESGLDIRYIQELLGHKSTKTTEIYTHVSRRNLISIRSPIDDLDLR
jgi:integrase/recombinase XerD